jgi:histone H3/H4
MVKLPGPELAVAPMHRICKKAGADRVSESAAKELAKVLDDIGVKIAREAMDYAIHAGRKTIKSEDVEIAARKVLGR